MKLTTVLGCILTGKLRETARWKVSLLSTAASRDLKFYGVASLAAEAKKDVDDVVAAFQQIGNGLM